MSLELRTLGPGDKTALEAFLARHAESSMFLRSNPRAAGLVDTGAPLTGTYVAAVEDGAVTAVAAHFWNGMVIVQAGDAPERVDAVARAAVERSGRARMMGIQGPLAHVQRARAALGLSARPAVRENSEGLFSLDLAALRVPPALASGAVACRRPRADELDLMAAWRVDYLVELFHFERNAALETEARGDVARQHAEGRFFVLEEGDRVVACSTFNASLPDCAQIGGVWTPRPLRGRGFARAVVAGSLLGARATGVGHSVLFTGDDNRSAIAAYEAIGFTRIGEYGLVLFADS